MKDGKKKRKWKYTKKAFKRRYCANPDCTKRLKLFESVLCLDCLKQIEQADDLENLMEEE